MFLFTFLPTPPLISFFFFFFHSSKVSVEVTLPHFNPLRCEFLSFKMKKNESKTLRFLPNGFIFFLFLFKIYPFLTLSLFSYLSLVKGRSKGIFYLSVTDANGSRTLYFLSFEIKTLKVQKKYKVFHHIDFLLS